jgi:predicted O-methyltransferase YrrM
MSHTSLPLLTFSPVITWNWEIITAHWVPGDPYQPEPGTEEYYRIKHAIADYTRATSICEIGVRAGYSAIAFLTAGHTSRYVGIDMDMGTDGGVAGYIEYAYQTVPQFAKETTILCENSQTLQDLPMGPYDLVHVDGDHSYQGAYHDTQLAILSGSKYVLIDDVDMMPDVSRAVMDVLRTIPKAKAWYVPDGGYRGNILIQCP